MIEKLKNYDSVIIKLFGKETELSVISTGDNQFDELGNYKKGQFELNEKELEVLHWFIENVRIEDYKQEIVEKPKEYAVSADLKKRLRGSFPVYEDGTQWLLCKVCMKAKPIFEFTEKGRYGNLGFCKYCSKGKN